MAKKPQRNYINPIPPGGGGGGGLLMPAPTLISLQSQTNLR